jgi:hypothetical protein
MKRFQTLVHTTIILVVLTATQTLAADKQPPCATGGFTPSYICATACYCPKPMPCITPLPCSCLCDDYCRKPMPCICPLPCSNLCDDYCRKPLPACLPPTLCGYGCNCGH